MMLFATISQIEGGVLAKECALLYARKEKQLSVDDDPAHGATELAE